MKQQLLLLFLSLFWLCLPAVAGAQDTPLSFKSDVSYEFGRVMRFRLTVENLHEGDSLVLFFRPEGSENTYTDEIAITPSDVVTIEHEVDLTQIRLDPFSHISYWWLLATDGEDIFTPTQTFLYEDDQFDWRQVSDSQVMVNWTEDDPGLGQLGLDIVHETLPKLHPFVPDVIDTPLRVYLYPTAADLRAALRLTGRDWVSGHASPELGVILVTAVNARTAAADLRRSIPHEIVHVLLYRATGGAGYNNLPFWFNEGLATLVEDPPNPGYDLLLQTAVAQQTTIPLTELCQSFSTSEDQALLAYAQSLSFVRYIQARFGNQALGALILAHRDGADCQSGVARILRVSLKDLNEAWLSELQPPTPLAQFFSVSGFWLLLLLGGFAIAGLLILKPARS